MAGSDEAIRQQARSRTEYEQGEDLFLRGKVRLLSSESFWKGEEKVRALVQEGERSYRVSLLVKDDRLYQASCQCPVHREYKGLCRHEVAAALLTMETDREEAREAYFDYLLQQAAEQSAIQAGDAYQALDVAAFAAKLELAQGPGER